MDRGVQKVRKVTKVPIQLYPAHPDQKVTKVIKAIPDRRVILVATESKA